MYGHNALNRLDFHNHLALDDEVEPVAAVQANGLVLHQQCHLPLKSNMRLLQLETETFLISGFQQARSKAAMNCAADDPLR